MSELPYESATLSKIVRSRSVVGTLPEMAKDFLSPRRRASLAPFRWEADGRGWLQTLLRDRGRNLPICGTT